MADPESRSGADGPSGSSLPPGIVRWSLVVLVAGMAILLVQLVPFNFTTGRAGPLLGLRYDGYLSLLAQAALFIPLGVTEGVLSRRLLGHRPVLVLGVVVMDAGLLALFCETAQYFLLGRTSSVIDLTACTLGGVAGYTLLATTQDLHRGG